MKICVPIEIESGINSKVSDHFGRAPFLAITDTATGRVDVQPSAGCLAQNDHNLGWLSSTGIEAVFCRGMGKGALAALREAGIDVYFTAHDRVSGIVEDIRANRMTTLPDDRACGGGTHRSRR